jgi:hypothetical protein
MHVGRLLDLRARAAINRAGRHGRRSETGRRVSDMRWPWDSVTERLADMIKVGEGMTIKLAELAELVSRPPAPAPDPIAFVLIEADTEHGLRTAGAAARVRRHQHTDLRIEPMLPLRDGRITVFCDLEQVAVHGIMIGPDLQTFALGVCPVAFFKSLQVGQRLTVQCQRTEDVKGYF